MDRALAFGIGLQLLQFGRGNSAHAAKAAEIGVEASVRVTRALALAISSTAHVRAGFPGTSAHDAFDILARAGRPMRIEGRAFLIITRTIDIIAPLRNVSIHVIESPEVGFFLTDGMSLFLRVVGTPGVLPQFVGRAEIVWSVGAGATGVLPFRFGRQS